MSICAEDLLIRGRRIADPFNRLGCTIEPVVAVIEFCQIVGPRPLLSYPKDACEQAHLDMDSIAIWLMSSETTSGTVLMIYNQQMGIYALSYYTLIYDIRARAFQRPICLAYLSSTKPTSDLMTRFTKLSRKYLLPIILCNRRVFIHQLSVMIQLSGLIENDTVQRYYSFQSDDRINIAPSVWQKILTVSEQARKLRVKMENMYKSLVSRTNSRASCCGHPVEKNNHNEIKETLCQFVHAVPLRPIKNLTPCTYSSFVEGLPLFHSQLVALVPLTGVLFSSGQPILQFPKYETPLKERRPTSDEHAAIHCEQSLKMITGALDQMLFPVLAGDSLLVCGSEQRKRVVMEFAHKLNYILPKSHSNRKPVLWNTDPRRGCEGIFGECVPKGGTRENKGGATFDLNTNVFKNVPYNGKLLNHLNIKRKFPDDESLISYITATLTWLCSFVYICRFISLQTIGKYEPMTEDDFRIIANLLNEVDFLKYNSIKSGLDQKRNTDAQAKSFSL
ncbi:unnamed protein product, partial [Mesorhabditis belari]|uniref:UDENN FLCN/SMCR8-type domain-containing protein n=1 Tax=Mesorhabditis belari TaxID=2138241 RepID=A0AAF3E867_9BILA